MKKILVLIFALFAFSAQSAQSPIQLGKGYNVNQHGTNVYLTATTDSVVIKQVVVNRGNCKTFPGGLVAQLPVRLKYGEQFYMLTPPGCNVIEVQVVTDKGPFTATW